jgi:hypothetical protein
MRRLSRPWRVRFSVLGAVLLALLMSLATSSGVALAQASSSVDLSPTQGPPGILVTATGSGWAAGDSIQAIWGSDTGPYVGSTATVNSSGGFILTFAVPSGTAAGSYQVFFYDETERYFEIANENFVVTQSSGSAPAAPSNLKVTPDGPLDFYITWMSNSTNQTGFHIYNGVTTETLNAPNMPAKGQGIAILWTGLAPNTYMCIKVAAFNQWGSSAYVPSSWTCATTPASWAGSGFCARYSNAPYTGETWNGVAACGNPYPANNQGDISSYNGVTFDTVGFQCVELAARYFYYVTGKIPPTPARGSDFVYDLNSEYGYSIYPTGSRNGTSAFQSSIKPGNIISMWSAADPVGHVGVVISVNVTNGSGTIKIMDENGSGTGTDTINIQKGTMSYPYAANESYNNFQWTTNMPAPAS